MSGRVFRIGRCNLTEHDPDPEESAHRYPPGHWESATCAEWTAAMKTAGGYDNLTVWSGFTNMEWSDLGEPYQFTEWGHRDDALGPVAASGGDPKYARPCKLEHAVFVPSAPDLDTKENQ